MDQSGDTLETNANVWTHLFASDDDDERGAGRGQSPREQGPEERLKDRRVILEHRAQASVHIGCKCRWRSTRSACPLRQTVRLRNARFRTKRGLSARDRFLGALSPPHCLSHHRARTTNARGHRITTTTHSGRYEWRVWRRPAPPTSSLSPRCNTSIERLPNIRAVRRRDVATRDARARTHTRTK